MGLSGLVPEWLTLNVVLATIIVFMAGVIVATVYARLGSWDRAVGIGGGLAAAGAVAGLMPADIVGFLFPFIEAFIRTLQAITVIYIPEIFPLDLFGPFAAIVLVSYVIFRMFQAADAAVDAAEEIDEGPD